jgi:hypothetical protein
MPARRLGDTGSAGWGTLGAGMPFARTGAGAAGGARLLGAIATESPLFARLLPRPPDPPLALQTGGSGEGSGGGDGGGGGEGGEGGGGDSGGGGEGEGGDGE